MVKTSQVGSPPKVGDHIQVYWPDDRQYYAARVGSHDPVSNCFLVCYEDGEKEVLDLSNEVWRHNQVATKQSADYQRKRPYADNSTKRPKKPRSASDTFLAESCRVRPSQVGSRTLGLKVEPVGKSSCEVEIEQEDQPETFVGHAMFNELEALAKKLNPEQMLATVWLKDETRRTSSPVSESHVNEWAELCSDLCMGYVRDSLSIIGRNKSALDVLCSSNTPSSYGWLRNGNMDITGLHSTWSTPLKPLEMEAEHAIAQRVRKKLSQLLAEH